MQTLTFEWMTKPAVIILNVDSCDQRAAIKVSPFACQKIVESLCEDQDDGRGEPMGNGAYTAMGIARALTRVGFVVEGLVAPEADLVWTRVEPTGWTVTDINFIEVDDADFEEQDTATDNQWKEEDPKALEALEALEALKDETNTAVFQAKMEAAILRLEALNSCSE
ncbi:MAG: hypothetical protein ACK4E9_20020 [Aeromonas media]